jgi:hypothetical protein
MSDKVTFSVDAEHAGAIQAFLNVQTAMRNTGVAGGAMGQNVAAGGEKAAKGWEGGLKVIQSYPMALKQMVSGIGGVLAVQQAVTNEFMRFKEVSRGALDVQKAAGPSLNRMLMNIPEDWMSDPKEKSGFIRSGIQAMRQPDGGVAFTEMAAKMFGAKGSLTEEQTKEAIMMTAGIAGKKRMPAEDSEALGGFVVNMMNAQITRGDKPDAKEVLGSILRMQSVAKSTTMHDLAVNESRGILYNYIHGGAKTVGEAVGFQAAIAQALPDDKGRRTSTGNINVWDTFREAYGKVSEKHIKPPKESGIESIADWDKLGPDKKLEMLRGDSRWAMMMRARLLGSLSTDKKVRNLALAYSWSTGSLEGEAGMRPIAEKMLNPNDPLVAAAAQATKDVGGREDAYRTLDKARSAKFATPQEKMAAHIGAAAGATAAAEFENTDAAYRGLVQEQIESLGRIVGTGWMKQKLRDFTGTLDTIDAEPAEMQRMLSDIYSQGELDIRARVHQRAYGKGHAYMDWARKKYGAPAPPPFYGELGRQGDEPPYKPYPDEVYQEWLQQQIKPQEQRQIETFRQFRLNLNEINSGGDAGAAPTATPAPTDSSSNQLIGEVRQLIAAIAGQQQSLAEMTASLGNPRALDVNLHDEMGREIARGTSQPRPIEQFYDSPGVVG